MGISLLIIHRRPLLPWIRRRRHDDLLARVVSSKSQFDRLSGIIESTRLALAGRMRESSGRAGDDNVFGFVIFCDNGGGFEVGPGGFVGLHAGTGS